MGRPKKTSTVKSAYGQRKKTTQDSTKSPSVVSTKIRQQKKLTNVPTSKSSLPDPKTNTKISKQVPNKNEDKNKSSFTKGIESENYTGDKKIKRLSATLTWNLKDKDKNVNSVKESELPKKNTKNEKNDIVTKGSKPTKKIASKASLKNDGPSTRRRSARYDDLNNKENAAAKVPDFPLKNVAKISKPPSKKYLSNTRQQNLQNDKNKNEKDSTEKLTAKSKFPLKNTTEIAKTPIENSSSTTRRQNGRFKSPNTEKEDSTTVSIPPSKNTTEIAKTPMENSSSTTRRQSGRFKSPNTEKEDSTTISIPLCKNTTEIPKTALENSTSSTRQQGRRLKPPIIEKEKDTKDNSTSKGAEPPKEISPRVKRRMQDLIDTKKQIALIRTKLRTEIKVTDKNSQPNKSPEPNRVLRKRNIIPNKYKDYTLESPMLKKIQQPRSPEPIDVYDFQYDPKDEPTKKKNNKKYESDSSDDDNSMKFVVKELRKKIKVAPFGKPKKQKKAKLAVEEQKTVQNKKITQNVVTKAQKLPKISIVPIDFVPPKKTVDTVTTETIAPDVIDPPDSDIIDTPATNSSDLAPVSINYDTIALSPDHNSTDSIDLLADQNNTDFVDSIKILDPSIQARNIVEEVTKSFFEDLSDDESPVNNNNVQSPKGLKILSNVVIRQSTPDKVKVPVTPREIFNSTVNQLKPAKPWRIDVSAIRRKPQHFSYKDKSFTPRYEPEFILNDPKSNLKEKIIEDKSKKVKQTYQASIVEYMNGLKPKLINNADNLFKDAPKKVQSPRKILGELNFVQSTPLKPHHANIFKSPNISVISSPKKKSDSMFGFSYMSDDEENKENMRRSPRKSPKKTAILVKEAVKPPEPSPEPVSSTVQDKENNVKQENVTINETDNSAPAMDSSVSIALFQDCEKDNLEVSKKCTRKYVRKNTKRRRLPSVDSLPSDSESESEKPVKKKQKNVRTKEEEQEVDRLASHYNSMFEEIEKYKLVIE